MTSVTVEQLKELKGLRRMLKFMEYLLWIRRRVSGVDVLESNIGRLKSYIKDTEEYIVGQQLNYVRETDDKKANPWIDVKRKGVWSYDDDKMLEKLISLKKSDLLRVKTSTEIDKNALKEHLKHVTWEEQQELGAYWVDDYSVSIKPLGDMPK